MTQLFNKSYPISPSLIKLRPLDPYQLHGVLLGRWQELAETSVEPNTFLSPDFILPYLKNFPRSAPPLLLTGEDPHTGSLLGLGIFEKSKATKSLPLPHLVPFRCKHLYRDGMLVAPGRENDFFDALLSYFTGGQEEWFGMEFRNLLVNSPWARLLRERAVPFGCSFRLTPRYQSPAVHLQSLQEADLSARWSSSRRKSMRRNRNRLEKFGPIRFRLITEDPELLPALNRFLVLEQSGWKGELGTSLLSDPADTAFVRDMTYRYAESGNLLVSELLVGEEVAASAINLKSGNQFYAFKIGWNDKFAQASPGVLHEVELINTLKQSQPQLLCADSCAHADSYLKNLWPDHLTVGEGLLSSSTLARGTGKLISKLRKLKRWASDKLRQEEPIPVKQQ